MFGTLLDEFDEITAVFIVAYQVGLVNDENERAAFLCTSTESNLFEFVEGAFNIEDGAGIARATYGEQGANVVFMIFEIEAASKSDTEDFQVCVRFHHGASFTVDFGHGIDQHGAFASPLLA